MADIGESAVFPVAFCDGEKEVNIGNVIIHPSINYKGFQSIISQKIGISANQITIYQVAGNRSDFCSGYHRKTLITGKSNFGLIVRGNECYFLAVLKRSRRDRRKKLKNPLLFQQTYFDYWNQNQIYEDYWQNFPICGQNYSNLGFGYDPYLCKECTQAAINKESPDIFHFCVYDPITENFRSPAGPVTPPPRKVYA